MSPRETSVNCVVSVFVVGRPFETMRWQADASCSRSAAPRRRRVGRVLFPAVQQRSMRHDGETLLRLTASQMATKSDFGQTDFGQKKLTNFGQPCLTDFGQTDFGHLYLTDVGQNWCFNLLAFFFKKRTEQQKKKGWARRVGGTKFLAFSLSRSHFRSFSVSLGVFSWNFGGVFCSGGA